jgi:hypothetical protein
MDWNITELNSSIIENFWTEQTHFKGNLNLTEKKQKSNRRTRTNKQYRYHFRTFEDNKAYYVFSVINAAENDDVMAFEALWKGKYIDLNNLKSMISKIIKKNLNIKLLFKWVSWK